jgi:hypothetical protein
MPAINTEIIIDAPPSLVRKIFLDFSSYPQWNPFITSVQVSNPEAPPGTPFKIIAWKFYPDSSTIVENDPKEFAWVGVIISKGFFQGRHYFKFEPYGDEIGENGESLKCKFVQVEGLSGFFSIFSFIYGPILKIGFKQMNKALKIRAESFVAAGEGQYQSLQPEVAATGEN